MASTKINTVLPTVSEAQALSALQNRNILIIGGTAGLGKALAVSALKRGAKVTVVGRRQPGPELSGANFIQKDLAVMKNAAQLADEVDIAGIDTIVFTNGIFAAPSRQANSEGIELDLAVSYLSRYVFARRFIDSGKVLGANRKDTTVKPRIFVMGFPGTKSTATIDDFNSEKTYAAMACHLNTVVGNEALVTYLQRALKDQVNVLGLNPGIIKTEIRNNYLGGGWVSWVIETIIGWVTPTPESSENSLLPTIISTDLETQNGAMIDSKRKIITANPWLGEKDNLERVLAESAKLADRALSAASK